MTTVNVQSAKAKEVGKCKFAKSQSATQEKEKSGEKKEAFSDFSSPELRLRDETLFFIFRISFKTKNLSKHGLVYRACEMFHKELISS